MDIAEVLGGIFLLIIGVLCVVPLPLDGWFYGPTPEVSMIGLVAGIFLIILGFYLIVAGFRSERKAQMREVAGVMCIILSFLVCFAGLIAESEFWTRVFLIFGVGFLVAGIGLVGIRTKKSNTRILKNTKQQLTFRPRYFCPAQNTPVFNLNTRGKL